MAGSNGRRRWHVNSKGEVGLCRAEKGRCPFASEYEHFDTREAAESKAEEIHRSRHAYRVRIREEQEQSEKIFNDSLTPLSKLDEDIENGDDRISKTVTRDGVTVYNIKDGYPFRYLQHVLTYRSTGGPEEKTTMAGKLLEDPTIWMEKASEEDDVDWHSEKSTTLSMSYYDLGDSISGIKDAEPYTRKAGFITYGFLHVRSHSIINVSTQDAQTKPDSKEYESGTVSMAPRPDTARQLTSKNEYKSSFRANGGYNEVAAFRYDKNGTPYMPDCMIMLKSDLPEHKRIIMKHAKAFNIPVVCVDNASYNEKNNAELRETLSEVTSDTSMSSGELRDRISKLTNRGFSFYPINSIGGGQLGKNARENAITPSIIGGGDFSHPEVYGFGSMNYTEKSKLIGRLVDREVSDRANRISYILDHAGDDVQDYLSISLNENVAYLANKNAGLIDRPPFKVTFKDGAAKGLNDLTIYEGDEYGLYDRLEQLRRQHAANVDLA